MKNLQLYTIALIASFLSSGAVFGQSIALTCGDEIQVLSQYGVTGLHPDHGRGQIVNQEMELGEVAIVEEGSTIILNKTQDAVRSFGGFGKRKGFGLYEAPYLYRLDLRNTFDNYEIYLEDLSNNKSIKCRKPKGDCC